jgi:PAS domain-containing protein
MSAWKSESRGSLSGGEQQVDTARSFRRQPAQTSIEASFAFSLREERPFALPARLFEQLPFAVYICDRDGLVLRYNRRAAEPMADVLRTGISVHQQEVHTAQWLARRRAR